MTEKKVKFSEIFKPNYERTPNLTDLLNMKFLIKKVEFQETTLGELAVVEVEAGDMSGKYHTFSQVLIKQLKQIKEYTDKGVKVEVTLRKRKRYFTFE